MERKPRVVVALDPSARDLPALDIVRCMIKEALPELIGLFIEDIRLLEHAHSRLAREVMHSGVERPLDLAALSRQLRAQSARVRRRFESAASELGLPCTFQIARGEVFAELTSRAAQAEALVVTFATQSTGLRAEWLAAVRQLSSQPVRSLLFAREGWTTGTSILAVIDESTNAESLLGVAVPLAKQSHSPLTLLLVGSSSQREQLQKRARGILEAETALSSSMTTTSELNAAVITSVVQREHARLLIMPWHGRGDDVDLATRLLDDIRSAVLLVR